MTETPIVAGIGASSTRESIELAKEAAEAGADFGMVIPPGYYAGALLSSPGALKQFFIDIATASPIPMFVFVFDAMNSLICKRLLTGDYRMIYNFPALTNGIDLDSDLIVDVVKEAPNICGVKLTLVVSTSACL